MAEAIPTVEYRDVPGFPGYRVGSDGSVWTRWEQFHPHGVIGNRSRFGTTWRQRKPWVSKQLGYHCVTISAGHGNKKTFYIHRLVLEAFRGPCPNGMEGCHADGDRANNALSNLRWDTRRGNIGDTMRHGRNHRGDTHFFAKLTADDVRAIRAEYEAGGISFDRLGAKYGVCGGTVQNLVHRRTWSHVT